MTKNRSRSQVTHFLIPSVKVIILMRGTFCQREFSIASKLSEIEFPERAKIGELPYIVILPGTTHQISLPESLEHDNGTCTSLN